MALCISEMINFWWPTAAWSQTIILPDDIALRLCDVLATIWNEAFQTDSSFLLNESLKTKHIKIKYGCSVPRRYILLSLKKNILIDKFCLQVSGINCTVYTKYIEAELCSHRLFSIGSGNCLAPNRRQAITWTNAGFSCSPIWSMYTTWLWLRQDIDLTLES